MPLRNLSSFGQRSRPSRRTDEAGSSCCSRLSPSKEWPARARAALLSGPVAALSAVLPRRAAPLRRTLRRPGRRRASLLGELCIESAPVGNGRDGSCLGLRLSQDGVPTMERSVCEPVIAAVAGSGGIETAGPPRQREGCVAGRAVRHAGLRGSCSTGGVGNGGRSTVGRHVVAGHFMGAGVNDSRRRKGGSSVKLMVPRTRGVRDRAPTGMVPVP